MSTLDLPTAPLTCSAELAVPGSAVATHVHSAADLVLFLRNFPRLHVQARCELVRRVIFEDNKACISISTGDTDKKRTKHIAKHWHFVREKCAAGLVVLKYLETALQVADMLTKQIFPKHFERLRRVPRHDGT